MKVLITVLCVTCAAFVAGAADEPLMPDGINQILGRVRPHMSEAELQRVVTKHYPDAKVVVGRWSGQTGYADVRLTDRFSISIAAYNAPNDFESRFVHQDMTIYVYDWERKRRINLSFHNWDDGKKEDEPSEQPDAEVQSEGAPSD